MPITEKTVSETLRRMGMPVSGKGFNYIKTAVLMLDDDDNYINAMVHRLYPEIAKQYGEENHLRVGRAIRHSIERTFEVGNESEISRILLNIPKKSGMPTNSDFLAGVYEYLKYAEAV